MITLIGFKCKYCKIFSLEILNVSKIFFYIFYKKYNLKINEFILIK